MIVRLSLLRKTRKLSTGYARLNGYLHKVNVKESNKCQCGAIESVRHYLLYCPLFRKKKEVMRKKLFENCGIIREDLNILLDARKDD